jgi:hypothetical protein
MKLKHNNKVLDQREKERDLCLLIALCALVVTVGGFFESRRHIQTFCPQDDCSKVFQKVVYAADIEKNSPKGIIERSNHPKQLAHIRLKESSNGTNKNPNALHNICKAQGKSNEFGYGGMAMMICFDSFEESVRVVDAWLTKRDNEALCYYNLGTRTDKCDYVK